MTNGRRCFACSVAQDLDVLLSFTLVSIASLIFQYEIFTYVVRDLQSILAYIKYSIIIA